MRKIIIVTFLAFAIVACTTIDCPVQNLVYTNYAIKKADGTVDTLNTDTLWIISKRANGTDTLLLNALCGSSATAFSLPISYTQPEDVFISLLSCNSGKQFIDTIRIKKDNFPHFESVDCQAAYFHTITAVNTTHNVIDSLVIHHPYVNYDITNTHYYIYFKAER